MILAPTIQGFIDTFKNIEKESVFELALAEWQAKHQNYTAAYISIIEAIVSFVCEQTKMNPDDKNNREYAKKLIHNDNEFRFIKNDFIELNDNRKKVAHSLEATDSITSMIQELNDGIKKFKEIIN